MSTIYSAAGKRNPGQVRLTFAVLLALGLAGCETGNNLLSGGGDSAPQAAIAGPTTAGSTPPSATQTARIEIAPVIGAPEGVARDLQSQLGSAIERSKITVARAPSGKGEYVVRGYIVAARERAGAKVSYIWDVTDQAGKRAHRITGEELATGPVGSDPWSAVSPQIVQNIADKTASQIATWHSGIAPSGTPVASNTVSPANSFGTTAAANTAQPVQRAVATNTGAPAAGNAVATAATPTATQTALAPAAATTGSIEQGPTSTIVPAVIGAPGDGSQSLTSAIQRELMKNGVNLTNAPSGPTYKVEGKVIVGQGKDGKQPIQIDWNVVDPAGKKLGTVSQKNEIPQGSLDGAWGKTADAAAAAAAQGIVKLLPNAKATN